MKKIALAGSLAIVGTGIWYLFFKNKLKSNKNPDALPKKETGTERIRHVFHKAKENDIAHESM